MGELGPVNFSSIALLRGRDPLYTKAASLFTSSESQRVYIVLNCMNEALTQQRYHLPAVVGLQSFSTHACFWRRRVLNVLMCFHLPVSRSGRLPPSASRTSWRLLPESSSGRSTRTPGTLCWPTCILLGRPRSRCARVCFSQAQRRLFLHLLTSWSPCSQVQAVSADDCSEARSKLESPGFWIPVVDGHKPWLKGLCAALLDSGGVKSEALLLSRPLCLVS